jgi:hypothetical protein
VGVQLYRDNGLGDGTTIQSYGWGAQLEVGPSLSSYMPSTTVPVTRAADIASMPLTPWYNQAAGAISTEYYTTVTPAAATQGGILIIDDVTVNNRIVLYLAATTGMANTYAQSGGVVQLTRPIINGVGLIMKHATSYGTLWTTCANGGFVYDGGVNVSPITSPSRFFFGRSTTSSFALNGYMRRIRYWPRQLSNAELQQATT